MPGMSLPNEVTTTSLPPIATRPHRFPHQVPFNQAPFCFCGSEFPRNCTNQPLVLLGFKRQKVLLGFYWEKCGQEQPYVLGGVAPFQ